MIKNLRSASFYFRYGIFNFTQQFSDLTSGITEFILFPFFIWLITRLWDRFNSSQGHYTHSEMLFYIGVTEILFMTFLRFEPLSRAAGDFSISLARPRSWLLMTFSGFFGHCLGSRIVYGCIFLIMIPLLSHSVTTEPFRVILRLLVFLPLLGIAQALLGLMFASAQILWAETSYFILPVSKLFLALGGVFGPLIDFGDPWRTLLLTLPPADLFFQPAHYCVRGEFYLISESTWMTRVLMFNLALWLANFFLYRHARNHHQSYGG